MGKPMKVTSLEDFKSSRTMITVWEYKPPSPISEVRKQTEMLTRLTSKVKNGTFVGKDFEEVSIIFPVLISGVVGPIIEGNLEDMLKALDAYDNQDVSTT